MKIKKTIMWVIVISFTVVFGLQAYAYSRYFTITDYNIFVNILPDGSADIEEHITYSFQGNFNGVFLNVDFSGSTALINPSVAIRKPEGIVTLKKDDSESAGTYKLQTKDEMVKFTVYEPSANEEKTFIYKYKLLDVATKYNDIAEFNRKMVGKNWETTVNNVKINITLPEGALKEDIRVFAHGPLTGESRIIDGQSSEFTVPSVSPGTFFETRVLFPAKLLPESSNQVDKNVLQEILDQEGIWAREANEQREKAAKELESRKKLGVVGRIITVLLSIVWIFSMIKIRKKYGTDPKTDFDGKYYREIPGNYTPAEMVILFHNSNVTSTEIFATLLDLVRKRVLILDTKKKTEKKLLKTIEKLEYVFSKNPQPPSVILRSHEKYLISWFFDSIAKGNQFILSDISRYVKDKSHAESFRNNFNEWKGLVAKDSKRNRFYPDKPKAGWGFNLLRGFGFIAAGLTLGSLTKYNMAAIISVLGLFMFFFSLFQYQRTEYGSDQYKKWMAFQRFIKDFSSIKDAQIPSIAVWEHYLVYAVPLGVAKEVLKQLPLVLEKNPGTMDTQSFMANNIIWHDDNLYGRDGFKEVFSQLDSEFSETFKVACSAYSSSSGSGGGASGGDSGGGGGGGGGGAF